MLVLLFEYVKGILTDSCLKWHHVLWMWWGDREWVSRFLTAHQHNQAVHYSAVHVGIRWKIRTEDKS